MVAQYSILKMAIDIVVNAKIILNTVMVFCIKKMVKYNVESG
jgi:hypothetical protein